MLFIHHFENIKDENLLRIHEQGNEFLFSIRFPDRGPTTVAYSEIRQMIDGSHHFETRLNMAKNELEHFNNLTEAARLRDYGRTELTEGRKVDLHLEIAQCEDELRKYAHIDRFFRAKIEEFRAGLITEFNVPNRNLPIGRIHDKSVNGTKNAPSLDSADETKHLLKHRRTKAGVDAMLIKLRENHPHCTLEEAKHAYAEDTDDTFENVNRLYYYVGKK
jgi:hypothetical protein